MTIDPEIQPLAEDVKAGMAAHDDNYSLDPTILFIIARLIIGVIQLVIQLYFNRARSAAEGVRRRELGWFRKTLIRAAVRRNKEVRSRREADLVYNGILHTLESQSYDKLHRVFTLAKGLK